MKLISHKDTDFAAFAATMKRRAVPSNDLRETVSGIIEKVSHSGDQALIDFTEKFDRCKLTPETLFVSKRERLAAAKLVPASTHAAIAASLENIHAFAARSVKKDWSFKNTQGAKCGERFRPFDRVGVYVPGGKAPLVSTALMTAGFAQAVGVPQILAATPCGVDGTVNPALLAALDAAGATEILKVGGAHAIAAMALGTASVQPVDRIFGPGNRFVVEAKRQLVGAVSIDLLPGPSEILILADASGDARCIAADILAQAEHGGDSQVGLLCTSLALIRQVQAEIKSQISSLGRTAIINEVLEKGTFLVHVKNIQQAIQLCNDYAPEHLSLLCQQEDEICEKISTAGAIYLGNMSPVAVGDFLAGPSHTLPTGGAGKSFSGLRADQFQRRTSIVKLTASAVKKSLPHVEEFSRIEGLDAHGRSVAIRLDM